MELLRLCGLAIVTVVFILAIKKERPEMALLLALAAGIFIVFSSVGKIKTIIDIIRDFSSDSGIEIEYMGVLIRIIGIAYITEFISEICRDAGENSIASKLEIAGKITILTMAIPILISVMELLKKIAEGYWR